MPFSRVFNATEQDFAQMVLDASHARPVMVDFWADWCPPCRVLTPVLERVTQLRDDVRLAKVEVDDNMKLAGRSAQCPRRTRFRQWAQLAAMSNVTLGAYAAVSERAAPREPAATSCADFRR